MHVTPEPTPSARYQIVRVQEIRWVEAAGSYVRLHLPQGSRRMHQANMLVGYASGLVADVAKRHLRYVRADRGAANEKDKWRRARARHPPLG